MKWVAHTAYTCSYPNPINFRQGECVQLGKRDNEYEGWIWVTTADGNQGWAPIQYLQMDETDGQALALHDYTARELNASAGDQLTLHYELNGWAWVEKRDGSTGWVPCSTIRKR